MQLRKGGYLTNSDNFFAAIFSVAVPPTPRHHKNPLTPTPNHGIIVKNIKGTKKNTKILTHLPHYIYRNPNGLKFNGSFWFLLKGVIIC